MTCLVCGGSGSAVVRVLPADLGRTMPPCLACQGRGSNPLRDCTSDDADAQIDALEADRARLLAEIEAITIQRDWAMAARDEALERLDFIRRGWPALVQAAESNSSRPEVRGPVEGETK